jgi:hypothetical protein
MGREGARLAEFLRIAGSASEQEVRAVEQCLQEQMGLVGVPDDPENRPWVRLLRRVL